MNEHDAWRDERIAELLSSTLDVLVDGAIPPGAPTAPEHNLAHLRRVVGRHRLAKAGAVGGSSLVAVGLAAAGLTQLPTWDQTDPMPAVTQSPSPSPTPSVAPSPSPTRPPEPTTSPSPKQEPTDRPSSEEPEEEPEQKKEPTPAPDPAEQITAPFEEGHTPMGWLDMLPGEDAYCGMPVERLIDGGELEITVTGQPRFVSGEVSELPVRIEGTWSDAEGETDNVGTPVVVWSQGGVIVDLGFGWLEGDPDIGRELATDGTSSATAPYTGETLCVPEPGDDPFGTYSTPRAAGTYEVRAVVPYRHDQGPDREQHLAVSDPVIVTVP